MNTSPNILVVDDEPGMVRYLKTLLESESYQVETATSGPEALDHLHKGLTPDVVLLDLLMPGTDGMETLERLLYLQPALKVVMLSCVTDPRQIVQAARMGAIDYLTKPFHKSQLDAVIKQCLDTRSGLAQPVREMAKIEDLSEDLFFLAASPAMLKMHAQVHQVAGVNVPILLLGESGTGKEVVARLIHKLSPRSHRTFLKVNCAALPGELLESELFGYEAGAFTGAVRSKPGKFELCYKGTILLDEIGEMPSSMQAKLLHVLQDQQFSRLGGRSVIQADVRILAATNVDIDHALETKRLRKDLFFRLSAITLNLPPLRERRVEIPLLLMNFMARFAARYARPPLPLSPRLLEACQQHPWPGNLRELENFVKRYLILGDEDLVLGELDASEVGGSQDGAPSKLGIKRPGDLKSLVRSLKDEAEMEAISRVLEETNWNRKEAARRLNISYKALLYKVRQFGLEKS